MIFTAAVFTSIVLEVLIKRQLKNPNRVKRQYYFSRAGSKHDLSGCNPCTTK